MKQLTKTYIYIWNTANTLMLSDPVLRSEYDFKSTIKPVYTVDQICMFDMCNNGNKQRKGDSLNLPWASDLYLIQK